MPGQRLPLQNLPYGRWRRPGEAAWHLGVAIGDQVLDLAEAGLLPHADMNRLMAASLARRRALRQALFEGLREGSPRQAAWAGALHPVAGLELGVPCEIGDYTDFYASIHHATTVGRQFRPEQPLLPNYSWVPIGYHGRASSIVASGQPVRRPVGQTRRPKARASPASAPAPGWTTSWSWACSSDAQCAGRGGGHPGRIPPVRRDPVQRLERACRPGSTSRWALPGQELRQHRLPWVVTLEAWRPARCSGRTTSPRPALPQRRGQPAAWRWTSCWRSGCRPRRMGRRPRGERLSTSNAADAFWTPAQLLTPHGQRLQPAQRRPAGHRHALGAHPEQGGSLLELSAGGKQPLLLSNGEQRSFLEDGDTVILRGFCQRPGWRRIGLGECRGTVLPARAPR
jgi:fumarylacetoacetase